MILERDAMGDDEYHPISKKDTNLSHTGSIGYAVIDAINTMLIMGLNGEYQRAKTWIQDKISFDWNVDFSTFKVGAQIGGESTGNLVNARQQFTSWAVYCLHTIYPWGSPPSSRKPASSAIESSPSSTHSVACHCP